MKTYSVLAVLLLTFGVARVVNAAEPHEIDLSAYHETFSETFRGPLDVMPWGPSKWIAHTPWAGDFGDAKFADPRPGFPFETGANGLTITARKNLDGKWEAGLLSSLDSKGHGFAQADGYFEARMKMPPGPGVWPAFWLVSDKDATYKTEIDVVEYYGVAPSQYHTNFHLWPKAKGATAQGQGDTIHVGDNAPSQAFHTYGVEISGNDIIYYFDRHEVSRIPAPPTAHQPMGILVNLALGSGWPIDKTPNPSVLEVDYIKAFKKK